MKGAGWVWELLLPLVLITIGIIITLMILGPYIRKQNCVVAQQNEIEKVVGKVKETTGRAGYETIYFKVLGCVENITYNYNEKALEVKYKHMKDFVKYSTKVDDSPIIWKNCEFNKEGEYLLKVYGESFEVDCQVI